MFKSVVERALDASAKHSGADVSYLKTMYAASPAAFRQIARLSKLAAHREAASIEAYYAAKFVGVLVEDCGPCAQIEVNMARQAGVSDAQIAAVLKSDPSTMSADTALGFRFAKAVILRSADAEEMRQAVRARWGDKGVIDLTIALLTSRIYPAIKAGLGFATACQRVSVGSSEVHTVRPSL